MKEATHDTAELKNIVEFSKSILEPKMYLGTLVGENRGSTPFISVADLDSALSNHFEPSVILSWDGDKTLSVKKTDGGVLATFTMSI